MLRQQTFSEVSEQFNTLYCALNSMILQYWSCTFSHGTTHVVTSIAQLCIPIYSKEYYVSAYGRNLVLERAVGGRKGGGAEFQNSNLSKLDKVIIRVTGSYYVLDCDKSR